MGDPGFPDEVLPISPRHDWTRGRAAIKVHLKPWLGDLEVCVAAVHPALPFALPVLPTAAAADLASYRAPVFCYGEQTIYDPISALLFFDPAKSGSDWPRHIAAILQGEGPCKAADIGIVLAMEALSWGPMGVVQWRMSRARVAQMKAGKWAVAVYGTHNDMISSSASPASMWELV
ncbi:hypothetical protein DFH07DRAFT_782480 [Mycena maculata]|uniref:Uncharacterized protein n=1 Tax=Mycena maculata TaxID=230809 RepID=A0AAD7MPT5_9AGAR|nr:hypothetical protein DFH07DRAFT_782480 [Mycena maculata]